MKSIKIFIYGGGFLFFIGIWFKVFHELGAGTFMGFGLAFIIYGYSKFFCKKVERKSSDYLFLAGIITIGSILFSLIQHRNFTEIFTVAIVISLFCISIEYIHKRLKER